MRLTEPDPDRRRQQSSSPGPRDLLARWGAIAKALAIFLVGGLVIWSAVLLTYGALVQGGFITSGALAPFAVVVLLLVALTKLYGAWVFPVRY